MKKEFPNTEYHGKIYIPQLDIHLNAILIPDEYLLFGLEELDPEGKERWGIIHGEFEEINKVTFMDCCQVTYLDNRGKLYRAMQFVKMFAGRHLQNHDERFISSVTLHSTALNEWFWESYKILEDKSSRDATIVNVKTGNLSVQVECKTSPDLNAIPIEIKMKFLNPINVYEFYVQHQKLQNLILFLANEDPDVRVLNYNDSRMLGLRLLNQFDRDWFNDAIEFSFAQIHKELEIVFLNWFEQHKLDNVRTLLLEQKYNHDLSKERYFLNMCIALESFHRRFVNDKVPLADTSAVENRERIKKYLESDEELLKWFKTKSAFWSTPTLYDRLIDLKEEYKVIVGDLFRVPIEVLIRNVKRCRDRLAHDGEYEMVFQEEVELFLVGYSLEMLLYVLLYKQHGVKEETLIRELQSRAHWNLKRLCVMNNYLGISKIGY